jgi:16S rRNA (guanine527-N7)-methyltransferase
MSPAPADPLPPERFEELLRQADPTPSLSPDGVDLLARYLAELDQWRRRINLTGQLDAAELVAHAIEALIPADLISRGGSLIDIGSGAGFPGVPLAIIRPEVPVTLLEPRAKRASFLRHVARVLPLPNAAVHESRLEDVGGQTFGAAATRAVGRLDRIVGEGRFLEPGGILLLWTTQPDERVHELPAFELEFVRPVPGSVRRVVAALRKRR